MSKSNFMEKTMKKNPSRIQILVGKQFDLKISCQFWNWIVSITYHFALCLSDKYIYVLHFGFVMRRKPFGLFHFSYSCGDERGGNHWWWRILWPSLYGQNSFSLIWNVQTLNQRHDRSSIGCSTESVSDIASKIISKIIYIFRRILIYNTCVLDGVLKMEFLLVHYMELSEKCVAEMKFSTYWHKVLSNARKVHGKYDFYRRWITYPAIVFSRW